MVDPGDAYRMYVAAPIPGGYTWTLASRRGHMLQTAEALFGERDRSYTPLGIEFSADGPQLWYPGNVRNIVIQLGLECLTSQSHAFYQLAHECVHLLSPTGGRNSTVLEEGASTYFSERYMLEEVGEPYWRPTLPSYVQACDLTVRLLEIDPEAIKRLREREPTFSEIGVGLILELYPGLGEEDAHRLASRFERDL